LVSDEDAVKLEEADEDMDEVDEVGLTSSLAFAAVVGIEGASWANSFFEKLEFGVKMFRLASGRVSSGSEITPAACFWSR
jgi:hypothetical protein